MPVTRRNWVHIPTLEEYSETFKEYFKFKRENGILEVRMHYDDGPVVWSYQMHKAIADLWTYIGQDLENEVIIFTATGDRWISLYDEGSFHENDDKSVDDRFDRQIYDTLKIVENFVNNVEVPVICAYNGPGIHWEMGQFADLVICTPDFNIRDDHFIMAPGHVPGDGMYMSLQDQLGTHRANAVSYLGAEFDSDELVRLGIVNEVVERDKLLDRAWEMARSIMKSQRTCRRMTHMLAMRPWKRLVEDDFKLHVTAEMYSKALTRAYSGFEEIPKY